VQAPPLALAAAVMSAGELEMVAEDGEQGFFRRGGHAEMRAVDMEDKLAHGRLHAG